MKHLKEEFDKLTFKDTLLYALTILSLTAAFVLLFCGLFIAPEGEIHESVLTAFGLVLFFVGALLGIDLKYSNMTATFKKNVFEWLRQLSDEKEKSNINIQK